jgi:hypothetical protein
MKTEYPISDEVLNLAQLALLNGEHFLTYNNSLYFIDRNEVQFFSDKADAADFAYNNSSDFDKYSVIEFHSITDILKHIPYGQQLRVDPDANGLHNKDGNSFTNSLIEHFESTKNAKIKFQSELLNSKKNL